jgi:hypothetical protein
MGTGRSIWSSASAPDAADFNPAVKNDAGFVAGAAAAGFVGGFF